VVFQEHQDHLERKALREVEALLAAQEKRVSLDQLEQEVILDLLVVREHPAGLEILAFPAIPDFQVSVLAAAVFFC